MGGTPAQATRRAFLRRCCKWTAATVGGTAAYGVWEASQVQVNKATVRLPNLPRAFEGKRSPSSGTSTTAPTSASASSARSSG